MIHEIGGKRASSRMAEYIESEVEHRPIKENGALSIIAVNRAPVNVVGEAIQEEVLERAASWPKSSDGNS